MCVKGVRTPKILSRGKTTALCGKIQKYKKNEKHIKEIRNKENQKKNNFQEPSRDALLSKMGKKQKHE